MKVPVVMKARAIISEEMMNLIFDEALCSRRNGAGGGGGDGRGTLFGVLFCVDMINKWNGKRRFCSQFIYVYFMLFVYVEFTFNWIYLLLICLRTAFR